MSEEKEIRCETKGPIELAIQRSFELMRTDRTFKVGMLIATFLFGFLFVIVINAENVVKIIDSLNKCQYQLPTIDNGKN